jgi:hypothetical protein
MVVGASFFSCCEATVTASRAAETSAKKRGQNTGTTLNAKLADPDQPSPPGRITLSEHTRLRARLLTHF